MSDGLDQPRLGLNEEPDEERREDVLEDEPLAEDEPRGSRPSQSQRQKTPRSTKRTCQPRRTSSRACAALSTPAANSRFPTATG